MRIEQAKLEYLDNLQRRVDGKSFQGLPAWHMEALRDCGDILDDHYCDELGIPRGSTIGVSIVIGKHWMYLDTTKASNETDSLDRFSKYIAGYIAGMMNHYESTNITDFLSETIGDESGTVRQHLMDMIQDKVRDSFPPLRGDAFDAAVESRCVTIMNDALSVAHCLVGGADPAPIKFSLSPQKNVNDTN